MYFKIQWNNMCSGSAGAWRVGSFANCPVLHHQFAHLPWLLFGAKDDRSFGAIAAWSPGFNGLKHINVLCRKTGLRCEKNKNYLHHPRLWWLWAVVGSSWNAPHLFTQYPRTMESDGERESCHVPQNKYRLYYVIPIFLCAKTTLAVIDRANDILEPFQRLGLLEVVSFQNVCFGPDVVREMCETMKEWFTGGARATITIVFDRNCDVSCDMVRDPFENHEVAVDEHAQRCVVRVQQMSFIFATPCRYMLTTQRESESGWAKTFFVETLGCEWMK